MKHGYGKLFVGFVALILLASNVSAAGLSTFSVGAKARGLGGAFRGIADDWSAAYWNPAGLAYLEGSELDFTMLVLNPRPSYTPAEAGNFLGTGFSLKSGAERYPDDRLLPFPSFSGFVRLPSSETFTFGAAIYWTQDANYIWNLYQVPDGYNNTAELNETDYRLDLDVWDFHPTMAVELIKNKLSAGVGLSIQRGDIVFRRMHLFANPWGSPYDVFPFDQLLGSMQFDGNGAGFGGNAGLLLQVNDKLTVGLTGQTPVTVGLSGVSDLNIVFPDNRGLVDFDETQTTYAIYYQGGFQTDRAPFEMDLKLPGSLGLGLAYQANDQWTLAADANMVFWSQMDEWKFTFGEGGFQLNIRDIDPLTEFVMPMDFDDQIQISLGAQYQARENLILRGGYSYDGSAIPDETFRPYFPDYGERHGISGGASFLIEGLEFAGQITGSFSGSRTVEGLSDINEDGQFDNFPGEYKANQIEVLLSTIYRF